MVWRKINIVIVFYSTFPHCEACNLHPQMEACYLSNWRIFLHSNSRPQRTNVAKEEWFNISQQFWLFPLSGVQRVFWFFCEEASNTRKKGWRANYMLLLVKHERTSDQKLQQSKAMFHMQENLVVPEKAQIILLWVLDHLKNLNQNQTREHFLEPFAHCSEGIKKFCFIIKTLHHL